MPAMLLGNDILNTELFVHIIYSLPSNDQNVQTNQNTNSYLNAVQSENCGNTFQTAKTSVQV